MASVAERGRRSFRTLAVILLLCFLAQSLTCFNLKELNKKVKQDKAVSETVMELRTRSIVFNGKELNSQSVSSSAAATGNDALLQIDADQSYGTRMLESTSEDAMANKAAWMHLNPSLHCGQNKMTLKTMGPRAADLHLDMGNGRPLPLVLVPETCGYSVTQNARGLILVVPYDGCNVIQENGSYVLPMSWLETPVNFTCPMSTSSAETPASTTPKPAQQPWNLPVPLRAWTLTRRKRQTNQPLSIYDPRSQYYLYWYYYYMYMTPAPSPGTTAKPMTCLTTKPSAEKRPQIKPPAYPYGLNYPYYPYYPYYSYYPLPNTPVKTTMPPAATTGLATTTKAPQKPPNPYYPPYSPYFPFYPPAGHLPYPQNPNQPMQSLLPPTLTTAKPRDPASTTEPDDSAPTTKWSHSSPTTKPTASAQTTKACAGTAKPSSSGYPGAVSWYVPYNQLAFAPYTAFNKPDKPPHGQKSTQAGYISGLQAQAPPHPGFHHQQHVPWFSPLNRQR